MKFVDQVRIFVKAGDGGDGHISFRKEKFVPKGGPDGGNGGKGGNVIFVVDPHQNTLIDFQYKRHFIAQNGAHGLKYRQTGKSGKDLTIKVPTGTVIKDIEGEIIADLSEADAEFVVAKGGNGGFGNSEFATATNQAPRFAKKGLPGEEFDLELELKLLADVGIVGLPNAGKSTLISVISAAKPKIADYPFTTLVPNLGIVKIAEGKSFTVADIPGLIEGASEGRGLGHQFLRHVERTTVLLFLISAESEDPVKDYIILRDELEKYNSEMLLKQRIIAISKCDILPEPELKKLSKLDFGEKNTKKLLLSSVSGLNINNLVHELWKLHTGI